MGRGVRADAGPPWAREHGAQALELDRHTQRTYERAMKEPVMLREQDLAAIAQELKHQGLQPGADADRALAEHRQRRPGAHGHHIGAHT